MPPVLVVKGSGRTIMSNTAQKGFTLVELMIAIAILVVIVGIAIPAYNGYIREARLGAARANIEPLRLALESHWLDNAEYVAGAWNPDGSKSLESTLDWKPDGDKNLFTYNVVLINGGSAYTISVSHKEIPGEPIIFTKP